MIKKKETSKITTSLQGNSNYLVQLGRWANDAHGTRTTDSLSDPALVLGRKSSLLPWHEASQGCDVVWEEGGILSES